MGMSDTIKIKKKNCKMIAHRGLSGLEKENTCAAFVAAGNRSYYGIETDVHVSADGKYFIFHDDNMKQIAGADLDIEKSTAAEISAVRMRDVDGSIARSDLVVPTLADYISICRKYGKVAVLELKNKMDKSHVKAISSLVKDMGWLDSTSFISFNRDNLVVLRSLYKDASIQLLTGNADEETFSFMKEYALDADLCGLCVTKDYVARLHAIGRKVNCWTINAPDDAEKMLAAGVDYMTTNILE